MKQATLLGGPHDGLELDVHANETEIQRPYDEEGKFVCIYQTYGPEGKTFNFIQYARNQS